VCSAAQAPLTLPRRYPDNVTLKNLYWFWFAPTLTYQIAFPKTKRVRWLYVASTVFRISVSAALIVFLSKQTMGPAISALLDSVDADGNFPPLVLVEALIKLAIPNTYIWLLVFYIFFHCWFNLLAELTCFGDRVFYKVSPSEARGQGREGVR
jgi:diacylglycerol O-acyltransferase-1